MSQGAGLDWVGAIRAGTALGRAGVRVIDAHAHLGDYYNFYIPRPEAASMVEVMDRLGIEQAWISALPACGADVPRGNDMTAAAVRAYPGRFVGYASVNPHTPERVRDELERSFDQLGLSLIKLHPAIVEYPISGPAYEPVWRFASERGAIVLSHTWGGAPTCSPCHFEPLARAHPDVTYLLGHSGGVPVGFREAIEVAQTCPNVYLDICCSTMSSVWLERIVNEVGSDRVLFGTDMPFLDPTYLVGRLACAALSDADKRRVFGQNAETLYARARRVERNA
ncbi:MAG: amidohydrolase [Anaerolineae bacterium]|nr:amidohydrolase [Anaerolineae bacterium]